MSGTELKLMEDIPHSTGNTFIIYSNKLANPKTAQKPQLSAGSGIASVSGGLDNENLTIAWKNNAWEITCKKLSAWGHYSFDASVKSKGSENRKASSCSFTFEVILLDMDDNFDVIFRQYRVGDKVNEFLEQDVANEVLSYGVWGQLYSPDENRYGSGLYLNLIAHDSGIEVPKITGTASRPGFYIAAIHCASDNTRDGFLGGTDMVAAVIVSIRDKNYEENQLMVVTDTAVGSNENTLRLIHCQEPPFTSQGGHFSIALNGSAKSGKWQGKYEEQAQTTVIVTEFQIALNGKKWELSRREYTQGEENLPAWNTISTVLQINGCNIPPSAGWSKDAVVAGDTRYYIPKYGLYDYKGTVDGKEIYQQQTIYTKQYDNWKKRNKEFAYDDGKILKQELIDNTLQWVLDGVDGTVEPQRISGVIVPYMPPTVEKYGNKAVRDLALQNINIHTSLGKVAMVSGNIAGGFWNWADERCQMIPYNGTSGDKEYYMAEVSATVEKYTLHEKTTKGEYTYQEGIGEYSKWSSSKSRKQGVKLDWKIPRQKLKYSRRDGNAFAWLMAIAKPTTNWEHTWEGKYHGKTLIGYYYGKVEDGYETLLDSESTGTYQKGNSKLTQSEKPTVFTFYIGSGADYNTGKWHNVWSFPRWQGGNVMLNTTDKELIHETIDYTDAPSDKNEYEYSYPASISFTPNFLLRIPTIIKSGEDFKIDSQKIVTEKSKFTAEIEQYQETWGFNDDTGDHELQKINIRLHYSLEINSTSTYTMINGKKVVDSFTGTMKKIATQAGVYEGNAPASFTTTVTYSVVDGKGIVKTVTNNPNSSQKETIEEISAEELIKRAANETDAAIAQAKEDVNSCELEKTNTYGDRAVGSWVNESSREELNIEN